MDFVSLGCCLLAFLLYYNTLDAGFVYDDRRAILTNPDVLPTSSWLSLLRNDFWGTPLAESGSHGSYRPLCVMSFRLNQLLGGFQPWGYHLVNVLLHCLATGLVVRVARRVFPPRATPAGPAVAGALFAAHPVHAEAVAGIVGRADLAACNFYLLAFLAYSAHLRYRDQRCPRFCACCSRGKAKKMPPTCPCGGCSWKSVKQWMALAACVVLAFAAVLSKETGVTVLVVCALYDVTNTSFGPIYKRQLRSLLILAVTLLCMLVFRLHVTWGNTPEFSTADNPTAKAPSIITRFLTFSYLPTFNFNLLLCPVTLSFDWSMDAIPRITSFLDTRNCISLFFYVSLMQAIKMAVKKLYMKEMNDRKSRKMIKTIRKRSNEVTVKHMCMCPICHHNLVDHHSVACRNNNNNNSVSACLCPAPVSKPIVSSHVAVLTSLAFLALPFLPATNVFFYVGFVVAERVLYLPSVGYCLLLGLGAGRLRKLTQRSNCWLAAVVILLLVFSVKTIRRNRDWFNEENLYKAAVAVNPPKAYGNLGTILSSQGRTSEAEWAYRKALEYRGNMADVHYNLGNLLQSQKKFEEAIQSYQKAIQFRPSLALAYVNLGAALVSAGRCSEAAAVLRQGSRLDGSGLKDRRTHDTARVSALLQLAALYSDQGRLHKAVQAYMDAVHTMPEYYPAQAAAVLRQGSRLDGSGLKDRRTHDTARVSALLQLAALYSDQGRLHKAVQAYMDAVHTMPEYYPAQSVYNLLGETLSRMHRFEEAERWYQAALQAQPDHVPAHITYGKLLAKNNSRIAEAEQWFRRAKRLAPTDPSVYHHYGEFLASQGRHAEAAVHYVRAAELKRDDYELAVAAATALRQAERRGDAERWYRRAVHMRPQDARGHTNLGAMLHLNGKYRQAADSYREALRLQPGDVTTLANLHKLYSLMA